MNVRERRSALKLSRKELAAKAGIDAAVLQLIELDQWSDDEAKAKLEKALVDLETGGSSPVNAGNVPEA